MWTHNGTWGMTTGTGSGQTRFPWLPAVAGVMGMVAVVTVVLNVFLLVAILLHSSSRSRSFHLHVVNMAIVAILQGAGVLPLWTYYLLQGTWLHGDSVCRWWLATDTMATSASALAIVITACDRFIYLVCWRFVKEGGKYILCCILMALAWLLALSVTLTMTLMELEKDGDSRNGVQGDGLCNWGLGKGERVIAARLIMYAVGAGLGAGLCLALVFLACLGMGHLLPIDDDEEVVEAVVRRRSLLKHDKGKPTVSRATSKVDEGDEEEDEDFPRFSLIKKTDRLEERERWKWQVISLLTVSLAWAVLWLPSHLFAFSRVLGLQWNVPLGVVIASVLLGYAHAAVMPLLWLIHQPIRRVMASLIFCRCCRENEEDEDDSLEFQDVGPYRQGEVTG